MRNLNHRFSLSHFLRFMLPVTSGVLTLTLAACGGSASKSVTPVTPSAPVVNVAITPKTPALSVNATQMFTATVTGTSNVAVTWSVTDGGSIDATGKYTAAGKAGTYHVVATSQTAPASSDTATVTVTTAPPVVAVVITPPTSALNVNAIQAFTATVTGTLNTAITWSVSETGGGSIDATGKYTAAGKAGTYHVVATSQAAPASSGTATVDVSVPAPNFTSTPTPTALQGTSYTYALAATDPAGTTVTFALTSKPDGATLSGDTLSWTPTPAESRVINAFTVTATTGAGGTNTQSWSVNPNGTIRGSSIDTYWGANGSTTSANDLSGYTFAAMVPKADGTYTSITGTGYSNGTFTIPGVSAGNYWLIYNDQKNDGPWSFWTDSSTFDIGSDYSGRNMSSVPCDRSTALSLNLTGLDELDYYSYLEVTVPNQSGGYSYGSSTEPGSPAPGSVTLNCPIEPSFGDVTYIVQSEKPEGLATGFDGYYAGPSLAFPALAASAESTTNVTAALASDNQQSFDIKVQGAAWAANFNNVGPAAATPVYFGAHAFLQPFVIDRATSQLSASLDDGLTKNTFWTIYSGSGQSFDIDAGTIEYSNPYPSSWLPVYGAYADASVADANNTWVSNVYATTTPQTSGFAPLMSAVQKPIMNGADFFTAASSPTDSVTLSWTAPIGLSAAGYEIVYSCVDATCPDKGWSEAYTVATSVTLPPGILIAGHHYVFNIGAIADSRANYNNSPYRSGYPQSYADVISAPLYINSSTASTSFQERAAVAQVAHQNVIRTKHGSFLVNAKGNKPLDAKARMMARFSQHRSPKVSMSGPAAQ